MSNLSRPRDRFYRFFLTSFIPVIVFFDCLGMYPPSIVPAPLLALRSWYITFFNDVLMRHEPAFFRLESKIELFYELPVAVYVWFALGRPNPSPVAYLHLLCFGIVGGVTTALCVFEYAVSTEMSAMERWRLAGLYGGYGVFFFALSADMFLRIQKAISGTSASKKSA